MKNSFKYTVLSAVLILSGCDAANNVADQVARDQAKAVVNGIVTDRFPSVNPAPVTDCIIDAASAGEILRIAGASVTGVTESTVEDVLEIAGRPASVECIARNSISLLSL